MKITDFLKGGTMKIQFNEAQLSRPQQESLVKVLDELQSQNENELVVTPVEFPNKLLVMLDDNIGMMLGWDVEKQSYAGLTTPERLEQDIKDLAKETVQEPEPTSEQLKGESLTDDKSAIQEPEPGPSPRTIPAAELVKSEVGQRVDALADALVKLMMPFDADQRIEIWIAFCTIVFKELLK